MSDKAENESVLLYTSIDRARAATLGLDPEATEKVAVMLADVRRDLTAVWVGRVDRALVLERELRAQRDDAEARLARVERIVTAPSYIHKGQRDARFVVAGREVLRALGKED